MIYNGKTKIIVTKYCSQCETVYRNSIESSLDFRMTLPLIEIY